MTKEDARKTIDDILACFGNKPGDGTYELTKLDAKDMRKAIQALSAEPCEDAINRAAAIKAMDDLEQEDIERYGCSIPEGFDGKRAIEALQSLPLVTPQQKMGRWISIEDVMSVFDDFMCGEVDEDGTNTFLEMLKDKAGSEDTKCR